MSELAYQFKVILIGAGAVGKTSLVRRFIEGTFSKSYKMTIGVDFMTKAVTLKTEELVKLTIWDIGGQQRFKVLRRGFYNGSHGALVVFDLSRADTYVEMRKWLKEMKQFAGGDVPFLLIGNKLDLIEQVGEVINRKEAMEFAENEGSIYIETSAKTGNNVESAFVGLTNKMVKNLKDKM